MHCLLRFVGILGGVCCKSGKSGKSGKTGKTGKTGKSGKSGNKTRVKVRYMVQPLKVLKVVMGGGGLWL